MNKQRLIKKFDKQVKSYEKNRDNRTLNKWRKNLLKDANGKVLEVGVGAGANFPYYFSENVEVLGVDFSSEMIKSARQAAIDCGVKADFLQQDVEQLRFEPNSFDCIVSTLSLCTYDNPFEIVNRFSNWCRGDGQILLMEHGLSSNPFLKMTQKMTDPLYRRISGCHWNRDIQKIMEESKLQITKTERYWSDMINIIWAKPV